MSFSIRFFSPTCQESEWRKWLGKYTGKSRKFNAVQYLFLSWLGFESHANTIKGLQRLSEYKTPLLRLYPISKLSQPITHPGLVEQVICVHINWAK